MDEQSRSAAEAMRRALIQAAESAYDDAGIRGLCAEGRWEAAVQAMRGVDLEAVAGGVAASSPSTGTRDPRTSESAVSAGGSARIPSSSSTESPG